MKREKRVMTIGAVDVGKSSLLLALKNSGMKATKTQAVNYTDTGVDIPGEYIENPQFYKHVIALAQEAACVILVQDATHKSCRFPPGFCSCIAVPVMGVITKVDRSDCDVEIARRLLKQSGLVKPIFETSAETGEGIQQLRQYLKDYFGIEAVSAGEEKR